MPDALNAFFVWLDCHNYQVRNDKKRTSRLDKRETPDTIQSAKQERSRRSIALYNNRIFTEEKNNIRVQFLLTSA